MSYPEFHCRVTKTKQPEEGSFEFDTRYYFFYSKKLLRCVRTFNDKY